MLYNSYTTPLSPHAIQQICATLVLVTLPALPNAVGSERPLSDLIVFQRAMRFAGLITRPLYVYPMCYYLYSLTQMLPHHQHPFGAQRP